MIRRATRDDAKEISRVLVLVRDEMPYLPRIVDGPDAFYKWPVATPVRAGAA